MACFYTDEKGCGATGTSTDYDLYNLFSLSGNIQQCFGKEKATCENTWIADGITKDCCQWGESQI